MYGLYRMIRLSCSNTCLYKKMLNRIICIMFMHVGNYLRKSIVNNIVYNKYEYKTEVKC